MVEVLGTAASIIAIIQLTATVASLCYEHINGVKRTPDNLQRFMNELKSLTTVLSNLQLSASKNPQVAKLWSLEDPINDCIAEMGNLKAKLEPKKKKKGWLSIITGLQWPLDEKETMEYIWRIERIKSHFMLALSMDQQTRVKSIEKYTQDISRNIQNLENSTALQRSDDRRIEVINWIYPGAFDKRHIEISNLRQESTGEWILEAPEVQNWIKNSRLLWGYGIPGAGKTFLSSFMIDHLQERASEENYGVAYIYFNFKEQDEQKPADTLASLVKQLACQIWHLPPEINILFEKLSKEQKRPTKKDLYQLLLMTAKSFTKTFIICDALDECDPESQRRELLPLFHQMAEDGMGLFLTSREYPEDIQSSFQDLPKIKLWAQDEDITLYIERKINSNPRAKNIIGKAKCKDRIISELIDCANGMFLLVHFHIEYLCKQTTARKVLEGLESLKQSTREESPLSPTYDRAIEILRMQPKPCIDLALRTFSWLVKARRVLTVSELQMALSVEQGQTDFDANNLPDRRTMLDVCASFVTVDDVEAVRFVHYTVQEYLLDNSIILPGSDFELAMACTTFLSFSAFSQCSPQLSRETQIHSYPFLDYAANHLHFHLNECDETLTIHMVIKFLNIPGNISCYEEVRTGRRTRTSALHIAAQLGHCSAAQAMLKDVGIMVLDSEGITALSLAARSGGKAMVQLLLQNGADIEAVDYSRRTALHYAARGGYKSVVQLLLQNGADIEAVDYSRRTALHYAARGGHESVVQLLLQNGADIEAVDNSRWTALHYAAFYGHELVVQLLLQNGADIEAVGDFRWTALHYAARGGHESVVQLLLQNGA